MRKVRGVTLMEVLVAMVLVAIISVTVYVSLSGSTQDAQVAWSAQTQDELQSQLDIIYAAARAEVAEGEPESEHWYAELSDEKAALESGGEAGSLIKGNTVDTRSLAMLPKIALKVAELKDYSSMGFLVVQQSDGLYAVFDPVNAKAAHEGRTVLLYDAMSCMDQSGLQSDSNKSTIRVNMDLALVSGLEWFVRGVISTNPEEGTAIEGEDSGRIRTSLTALTINNGRAVNYQSSLLLKVEVDSNGNLIFETFNQQSLNRMNDLFLEMQSAPDSPDLGLYGDALASIFSENGVVSNASLNNVFLALDAYIEERNALLAEQGEGDPPSDTTDAGTNPGDGAGTNPDGGAGSDPGQGSGGTVAYPYTETDAYGTTYTYYEDGSYSYQDQYGNSGQYYADGSYYHKYSDGTKETYSASTRTYERFGSDNSYTFSQNYEDGSSYYYNTSSYGTYTSRYYADGSRYYSSETDYGTSTSSYSADGSYSNTYRNRDGDYSESSYDASDRSYYSYNEYSDGSWTTFSSGLRENGDSYSYTEDSSGYWSTTESGQAGNDSWSVLRNSNGYYSESHNGTDKNGSYSYTSTQGVSYSGVSFSEYSSSRTDLNGFSSGSGYISYADGSYSEYEWDDSGYNYSWSQDSKGNWYSYNYGTNYYNSSWGDNNQSSNYGYGTTSSGMQYTESGSYTSDPYYYTYSTTYEVSGTASYTTGYDGRTNYYVYNDGKNTYNYSSYINPDIFLNGKVTTSGVTYYFGENGVIYKEDAKGNLIVHMQPT